MDILTLIAVIVGVVALSWWIKWSSKGIAIASNMWGLGWSPGVRGATINAIASSLPELITATVFLVVFRRFKGLHLWNCHCSWFSNFQRPHHTQLNGTRGLFQAKEITQRT